MTQLSGRYWQIIKRDHGDYLVILPSRGMGGLARPIALHEPEDSLEIIAAEFRRHATALDAARADIAAMRALAFRVLPANPAAHVRQNSRGNTRNWFERLRHALSLPNRKGTRWTDETTPTRGQMVR